MTRHVVLATFVLAALTAAIDATAEPVASRLVDRTVVCDMPQIGYPDGPRFMTFSALKGVPASMFVSNGPNFEARVSVTTGPSGRDRTGSVLLNVRDCAASSVRIRFSSAGLRGGLATPFGRSFDCDVPSRVLVRVRAEFRRPTAFMRDRQTEWLLRAAGRIASGSLAVSTLQGKPIGFASVDGISGKAQIYVAPSRCTRSG